jgi:glycosyltransferase involved in cell wall biosynthesis
MKLLYIGNFLQSSGKTPPPADMLLQDWKNIFQIRRVSSIKSPTFRLFHMIGSVIWGKLNGVKLLIIDVFSSNAFWYAFLVSELGHWLRMPLILVLHGGDLPKRFKRTPKCSHRLVNHAAAVVSPSGFLKFHAQSFSGKTIKVIGNPLQLNLYPCAAKKFNQIHILWVRSFHHIYRPEMAVELCVILKNIWPEIQLTMIGPDKDGSLNNVRILANSNGLDQNVNFKGLMSKAEWIKESEKANIFINTSRVDNTPVSVLEALALGLPVVSTNVGGIPHLLEHEETALLVKDGDVHEMGEAIKRIMFEPSLRNKLILNGRALAEEMDIKNISEQWKVLINEVIS